MAKYLLQNSKGAYLKTLDTAQSKIEFTENPDEAINYNGRPGGGRWDAENEAQFIQYHFSQDYGEQVTSLKCVYLD